MKYKGLPRSFSRQFQDMNTYTRAGKPARWEQDFLKEQSGISYEEDKQTYKRLQEHDHKYDDNTAEYYEHFHCLWYWDNNEADWTKELRNNRDKDIYGNLHRVDLISPATEEEHSEEDLMTEVTHNVSYKLEEMEKTAEIISIKRVKTHMSAQDYQYHIDPYATRWADLVIDSVDRKRHASESNDIEVGLIKLPIRTTKLGYKTGNSELFVATLVFSDGTIIREAFKDIDLARIFLEEKRNEYNTMAFSWGAE
jgi:hypothetical protein